ncbi:RNA polymerase sigma factor [Pareuzebyella sediminis]|uniref:RNA polymerase sigma factor n=1 Tax=Pareuzebyella sediminis TaxID=2607998 RepID=UPI001E4CA43B|nr:sigma-70 family RNA polymerase sigma factor [Pareuzebyella sediminis]
MATNQEKTVSSDFYTSSILPYAAIIIKICRAYTNSQVDFEDYYQEVCLQIWKSKDNFKKQSKWSTWVYRISLNVCLTLLKKRKNNHQYFASDALPEEATEESHAFSDESLNQLYDAIKQLSEVDRGVILLYLEEKSYQEIADIIGTNANNIGVRINRIKERLKKVLDGKVN